jgi:hypothetical protein
MIITNLQIIERLGKCEFSADIIPETSGIGRQNIWYRFPLEYRQFLVMVGDPFLAFTLPSAMVLGESIKVEAPVSPRILASIPRIQAIYKNWIQGARPVEVSALPFEQSIPKGEATGSFFSAGVDSWHTLLKNKASITHLILLRGFDRGLRNESTFRKTLLGAEQVADAYSKKLLLIESNFRNLSDPHVEWIMQFGASLVSTGLLMPGLFQTIIIPANEPYDLLHPIGSDPLLDPLWSTENISFDFNGCEASRLEKVRDWICHTKLALQTLRVCWKYQEQQYNCCKCEKCLRTMLELHISGCLAEAVTFPKPLLPKNIRRLKLDRYSDICFALESLDALTGSSDPFDRKICRALRHAIRMGRFWLAKRFWGKNSLFK